MAPERGLGFELKPWGQPFELHRQFEKAATPRIVAGKETLHAACGA
jgi:hypothetical protein